jgi:hypothetical protein
MRAKFDDEHQSARSGVSGSREHGENASSPPDAFERAGAYSEPWA